jgi:hypothetical protein
LSSQPWLRRVESRHGLVEIQGDCITHAELSAIRERSYRNGNWRKLTRTERALYNASLGLARLRGKLVNSALLATLRGIIVKLLRRFADVVFELGARRAEALRELYRRNGVFSWLPLLEGLLDDEGYVLWLGNRELILKGIGVV